MDGGASRSRPLLQFQADLLGVPVVRPKNVETTAMGAAYFAGLAVGYWRAARISLATGPVDTTFHPAQARRRMAAAAPRLGTGFGARQRLGDAGLKRADSLDRIRSASERFDFLVIGGGATGLGAAVDAVARGHRVALIEQADFASATSSRSTKLVHGGVRYLRQGNISLVLEALRERGRLARNAPHLVHDLAFVIPNYSWWEGPFYGVGMKVYDQLAGRLGLSPSRVLSREETIGLIPTVEADGLVGGVVYHDGQFDDSRLAVNLAQTAEGLGAAVVNYCSGRRPDQGGRRGGRSAGPRWRERNRVRDPGPRGDQCHRRICRCHTPTWDQPDGRELVAVSQGIHIVLPKEFLPGNAAIMIPKTADGRVLFAFPGTTGWWSAPPTRRGRRPSMEPRSLPEEREFVMEHARRYLARGPKDERCPQRVRRPSPAGALGRRRPHRGPVARSYHRRERERARHHHRRQVDHLPQNGRGRDRPRRDGGGVENRRSPTETLSIRGWSHGTAPTPNLQPYGTDAAGILAILAAEPALAAPLHPRLPYQQAEVIWHAREEMARTVADVLARRTRALLLDARASIEAAPAAARLLARELKRDQAWERAEVKAYTELARGYVYSDPASVSS